MVEAIYYVEDSERYFPQNCGIIIKNNNGKRSFTFYDEEEFIKLVSSLRFRVMNRKVPIQKTDLSGIENISYRLYEELCNFKNNHVDNFQLSNDLLENAGFGSPVTLTDLYYLNDQKLDYQYDRYQNLERVMEYFKNFVFNYCNKKGISFDNNPESIIKGVIKEVEIDNAKHNEMFGFSSKRDFSICISKDSILEDYNKRVENASESESNSISHEYKMMRFDLISIYFSRFIGEFESLVINVFKNKKKPDEYYKDWAEFFVVYKDFIDIIDALDYAVDQFANAKDYKLLNRLKSNEEFMSQLDEALEHDPEEYCYRYHATTSELAAKDILDKGLYVLGDSLDVTTVPELTRDGVLLYEYGNGFNFFGDYIIVVREKVGESILRETTEEEKNNSLGLSRRVGSLGTKAASIVDPEFIVGYVDKEHGQFVKNPVFKKETGLKM